NNHHGTIVGATWVKLPGPAPGSMFELEFPLPTSRTAIRLQVPGLLPAPAGPVTLQAFCPPQPGETQSQHPVFREFNQLSLYYHQGQWVFGYGGMSYIHSGPVPTGVRAHVAGVRDGNELRLYVDGRLRGRINVTGPVPDTTEPLGLARGFTGRIGE